MKTFMVMMTVIVLALLTTGAQAVTVTNTTTSTQIFYDGFEGVTPSGGDDDPVAVTGSWTISEPNVNTDIQVISSGASEGSNCLEFDRAGSGGGTRPDAFGVFTTPPSAGQTMHIEFMVYMTTGQTISDSYTFDLATGATVEDTVQTFFNKDTTDADGEPNEIWFYDWSKESGDFVGDSGLRTTFDTWEKWQVDYTVNAPTLTLTIGSNSAELNTRHYVMEVGDCNWDRVCDFEDYLILESEFGAVADPEAEPPYDPVSDFDDSGVVDFADYLLLEAAFGTANCGGVPAAVGWRGGVTGSQLYRIDAVSGGGSAPSSTAAVPEPATLFLFVLVGGLLRMKAMRKRLMMVVVSVVCVFGLAGLSQAASVALDITAGGGTWQVTADVSTGDCEGLASFLLDVVGSEGLTVTSSTNETPISDSGFDLFGFYSFRDDGTAGEDIAAGQPTLYSGDNDPSKDARVLQQVGQVAGSKVDPITMSTISWTAPVVLASGTYSGTAGVLTASASGNVLSTVGEGWEGPGNVETATWTGDSIVIPEPATIGLILLGSLGLLKRRS